jgi:hypothetical protein
LCLLALAALGRIVERVDSFLISPSLTQQELFGTVLAYPWSLSRLEISFSFTGDLVEVWTYRLSASQSARLDRLCRRRATAAPAEAEAERAAGHDRSHWCLSRRGSASARKWDASAEVDGPVLRVITAPATPVEVR